MKHIVFAVSLFLLLGSGEYCAAWTISMSTSPEVAIIGEPVRFQCEADPDAELPLKWARIHLTDSENSRIISRAPMVIDGSIASYELILADNSPEGTWKYKCIIKDQEYRVKNSETAKTMCFMVPPTGTIAGIIIFSRFDNGSPFVMCLILTTHYPLTYFHDPSILLSSKPIPQSSKHCANANFDKTSTK